MKIRLPLLFLSACLLASPVVRAEEAHSHDHEKHTELGDRMEKLNKAWRALRKQIADPAKNADSLALVATIRQASAGAEKLTPEKEADLPEADRAKFQADYAANMKKFADLLDKLEAALKANNNEEAGRILNDINQLQRDSHKAFRKEKPKQ